METMFYLKTSLLERGHFFLVEEIALLMIYQEGFKHLAQAHTEFPLILGIMTKKFSPEELLVLKILRGQEQRSDGFSLYNEYFSN